MRDLQLEVGSEEDRELINKICHPLPIMLSKMKDTHHIKIMLVEEVMVEILVNQEMSILWKDLIWIDMAKQNLIQIQKFNNENGIFRNENVFFFFYLEYENFYEIL